MANRSWLPMGGSLEVNAVELWGSATIGGTGAVSSFTGKGITSITRLSAGQYSVNLQENYNLLLWANAVVLHTTDDNPTSAGVAVRIKSQQVIDATAPNVIFQFYSVTGGAATDPASGAVVLFDLVLRNSSVT